MTESPLGTEAEVAAFVKRSPETLRFWRWNGGGPPWFKIGRRVMYRWTEVEKWVAEQEKAASH